MCPLKTLSLYQGAVGLPVARPFSDPRSYGEDVREVPHVVVIGAGVTGLTVAQELAERGFAVQVVEPAVAHDEASVDVGGLAATQYAALDTPQPCRVQPPQRVLARTRRPLPTIPALRVGGLAGAAEEGHDLVWSEGGWDMAEEAARRMAALARRGLREAMARHALEGPVPEGAPLPDTVVLRVRPDLALGDRADAHALHEAVAMHILEHLSGTLAAWQADLLASTTEQRTAQVEVGLAALPPVEIEMRVEGGDALDSWTFSDPTRTTSRGPAARLVVVAELPTPGARAHDHAGKTGPCVALSFDPDSVVPGEHGYRFFPRFYRHVFDTMKRTPTYDADGVATYRSTYDNLVPTTIQGIAYSDDPATAADERRQVQVARDRPRSFEELRELQADLYSQRGLRFTEADMARYQLALFRYMTACPERRERWAADPALKSQTWWDFIGADEQVEDAAGDLVDRYSKAFKEHLQTTSLALVAMDHHEVDVRTYGNIGLQLLLDQVTDGGATDMTLNGPTSDAWLSHWKHYLLDLGVRFFHGRLTGLAGAPTRALAGAPDPGPAWGRMWPVWGAGYPEHSVTEHPEDVPAGVPTTGNSVADDLPTGTRAPLSLDQGVQPTPDPAGPAGVSFNQYDACGGASAQGGGSLADSLASGLDAERAFDPDYYVLAMPLDRIWRLLDDIPEDALDGDLAALRAWRTQVLTEPYVVQYDTEHPWYEDTGRHGPFRHFSGVQYYFDADFKHNQGHVYFPEAAWGLSSISQAQFWHVVRIWQNGFRGILSVDIGDMTTEDPAAGTRAFGATADEVAVATWGQVLLATPQVLPGKLPPPPRSYHLDAHLHFASDGVTDQGPMVRNTAPFLINRPGEWEARPGTIHLYDEAGGPLPGRDHVAHHVAFGRWVLAGTFMKTFTRMATMEAANESARHAVNSILADLAGRDEAEQRPAAPSYDGWRSAGVLMGDLCQTWNMEAEELDDLAYWKRVDRKLLAEGMDHMVDILELEARLDEWLRSADKLQDVATLAGLAMETLDQDWDDLPGLLPPGVRELIDRLLHPTG